jgi:uncharacterized protein
MNEYLAIEFEIREQKSAPIPMTFTGLAVPWGVTITLGDGSREQFVRGSIPEVTPESPLPLLWSHDARSMPVGTITQGTDTEEGYVIECRLSDTTTGREAYALLKDGALKGLSIGFKPVTSAQRNGIEVRTSVLLREVSLCNFPAYGTAQVIEVREEITDSVTLDDSKKGPTMDEETMGEIRSQIDDLGRQVALLATPKTAAPVIQTRSFGEAVKGLIQGQESTEDFNRAVDSVLADTNTPASTWVSKAIDIVEARRPIMSTISRAGLPDTGQTIEYPFAALTTGTVGEQVNEGDALNVIKVNIEAASAAVKTYGAYSNLSRQSIERSSVDFLNLTLKAQLVAYAKATSGAVASALAGCTENATASILTANLGKAGAWTDLALGATLVESSSGLIPSVMVVSLADFRKLAGITDSAGRPVFALTGDNQNAWGSVDLKGVRAVIGGFMPVVPVAELTEGTAWIYDPSALTFYESAGAPVKITDQAIANLTSQFAIYGYGAVSRNDETSIVKVTLGGV